MDAKKEKLVKRLGALQRQIKEKKIPVEIIVEGLNASGKGTLINSLMVPLDPHSFAVYDMHEPDDNESKHYFLWRYFTKTPDKGQMVLLNRSYYRDAAEVDGRDKRIPMCLRINNYERMLSENGTVIVKCFIRVSQKEQRVRLKRLSANKATAWRVTQDDLDENKRYDKWMKRYQRIMDLTDTDRAPWHVIDGDDGEAACLQLYQILEEALASAIESAEDAPKPVYEPIIRPEDAPYRAPILENIVMDKALDRKAYKKALDKCQKKLRLLEHEIYRLRIPVIIAFEGFDAGGKGGAIKRICENLDPRGYRVFPTGAPTDVEKNHNWMWRFWQHLPKYGHVAIFDRTWYGRVLVEPIEGFLTREEYQRAFREINDFEEQLTEDGTVLIKFWMNITKDEQERRFKEREKDPDKRWKITEEDWRNRDKWDAYLVAADRMFLRTSTEHAPWTIVEGNDKYYARIKVLKTVINAIEQAVAAKKAALTRGK